MPSKAIRDVDPGDRCVSQEGKLLWEVADYPTYGPRDIVWIEVYRPDGTETTLRYADDTIMLNFE